MSFPTAPFAWTILVASALAAGPAASAQPISIESPAAPSKPAKPASDCAAAAPGAGADIECVLSLTPPQAGDKAPPAQRILIRAQWAAAPCAPRGAQVVTMAALPARAGALPIVDQPRAGAACAS